ncbi:NACHT domain-containing protein [Nakamurella sp. GG22]
MSRGAAVQVVARNCAVQIHRDKRFLGSGFFVAPEFVMTCAHVVGQASSVTITWQGHTIAGTVVVRLPDIRGDGEYWAYPDIAVIALSEPPSHPVCWFDTDPATAGDVLDAYGFSTKTPSPGAHVDSLRVEAAGSGGQYLRIKDDQVVAGLSGCHVVNQRTGLVAGIVKASKGQALAVGGWIIPAPILLQELPQEILTQILAPRRINDEWLQALLLKFKSLLRAQQLGLQSLPYRLLEGPVPPLSQVYVRQNASWSSGRDVMQDILAQSRDIILVGAPGAGKSATVQHICAETATWWQNGRGPAPYGMFLAVRVAAAALAAGRALPEAVSDSINHQLGAHLTIPVEPSYFSRRPAPGIDWLILVDGLDEILLPEERRGVTRMLAQHISSENSSWRYLITTRPMQSVELKEILAAGAQSCYLLQFDPDGLAEFARNWFDVRSPSTAQEMTDRFLAQASVGEIAEVVQVPLFATIAAIVFEASPERALPTDTLGLYDRFMRLLLSERRYRLDSHAVLRDRLMVVAGEDRKMVAVLFEVVEELLDHIAHIWYFDSSRPIDDIADSWLRVNYPAEIYDVPQWPMFLRQYLAETGILIEQGHELQWIHLSFAEYLVARALVKTLPVTEWAWLAQNDSTANIARMALAMDLKKRKSAVEILGSLLKASDRVNDLVFPALLSYGKLISDHDVQKLTRIAIKKQTRWRFSSPPLSPFARREAGLTELKAALGRWWLRPQAHVAVVTVLAEASADRYDAKRYLELLRRYVVMRRYLVGTRTFALSSLLRLTEVDAPAKFRKKDFRDLVGELLSNGAPRVRLITAVTDEVTRFATGPRLPGMRKMLRSAIHERLSRSRRRGGRRLSLGRALLLLGDPACVDILAEHCKLRVAIGRSLRIRTAARDELISLALGSSDLISYNRYVSPVRVEELGRIAGERCRELGLELVKQDRWAISRSGYFGKRYWIIRDLERAAREVESLNTGEAEVIVKSAAAGAGPLECWILGSAACEFARSAPRGSREILLWLLDGGSMWGIHERRIRKVLRVLGGPVTLRR